MADDRPNIGSQEVFERTKQLLQDKPEYKKLLERVLDAMEEKHEKHDREDPTQVDYRNTPRESWGLQQAWLPKAKGSDVQTHRHGDVEGVGVYQQGSR